MVIPFVSLLNLKKTNVENQPILEAYLHSATEEAKERKHEFVTIEHLLKRVSRTYAFEEAVRNLDLQDEMKEFSAGLDEYLDSLDTVSSDHEYAPDNSYFLDEFINILEAQAQYSSARELDESHILFMLLKMPESQGAYLLRRLLEDMEAEFIAELTTILEWEKNPTSRRDEDSDDFDDFEEDDDEFMEISDSGNEDIFSESTKSGKRGKKGKWRQYVECVSDTFRSHNPLIGREAELDRTILVLCRKDKNNPLHLGLPGVGKTALVYGLAARVAEGNVPERLRDATIYRLDMATMLAGTQFRGDMEKRFKLIMDGAASEKNPIIYIDEIHTMVGAGAVNGGSNDVSNMLKPYLEDGRIRFIGSTTYEEFNRNLAKQGALLRRFQQIDITEPTPEETLKILKQLKPVYEQFHGVTYSEEALEFAVSGSQRHITDRQLPDKAIDLIDEAGAYRQIHPSDAGHEVGKDIIADILARICKVESLSAKEEDNAVLEDLRERISAQIYGQDQAVAGVAEAVQMARAGLTEPEKPLASFLFVGPTGVGKTEVAKVLAAELGLELIRFDMSEYMEKHSVAKLIGAPAGYVGYDDGGLLTDAVRRSPNCVLLLDEIEKAHEDVYNILLQVMDYGCLTDNKGRTTDFRNAIIIMTSNAGAQHASKANVGFASSVTSGDAMLRHVKRVFKPEFLNRLSGQIVFRDMDMTMASLILDKKLRSLRDLLAAKNVEMELSEEARASLLEEGFTREYGAREMDRVISRRLKPLLMREILFGGLKKGGRASIGVADGELCVTSTSTHEERIEK